MGKVMRSIGKKTKDRLCKAKNRLCGRKWDLVKRGIVIDEYLISLKSPIFEFVFSEDISQEDILYSTFEIAKKFNLTQRNARSYASRYNIGKDWNGNFKTSLENWKCILSEALRRKNLKLK